MRLVILSCVSGVLSYLSISLPHFLASRFALSDDVLLFLPGVIFGVLILVPRVTKSKYSALRWLALLILSVGAWYAAVATGIQVLPLVKQTPILSCGISGSIGVLLLAAGSRYLIPWKFNPKILLTAALVGFVGGSIIGMAVRQPRASLAGEALFLAGFLCWHCGVALALFGRPQIAATEKSQKHRTR